MSNFGKLKSKLLTKLTESYNSGNKNEIKRLIKKIKTCFERILIFLKPLSELSP